MNIQYYNFIKDLYFKHGIQTQNINIFGIRNTEKQKEDFFNDWIGYFTPDNEIHFYRSTTDPGIYWTLNPENSAGTAHLCLGYHENIWVIAKHRGQYTALCNTWRCNPTRIWRDANKDTAYKESIDKIYKGRFGINLHRADALQIITKIGRYSAGCQVIQNPKSYNTLLTKTVQSKQSRFSYFLFDKLQIPFFSELTLT